MNTEVSTESDDSRLANLRKKHADHCELITTSGDSLEGNEIAQFFACKQKLATHAEDFSRVEAELDSKLDDLRTWAAPLSESGFSRNSGDTLIDLAALAIGAFAVSKSETGELTINTPPSDLRPASRALIQPFLGVGKTVTPRQLYLACIEALQRTVLDPMQQHISNIWKQSVRLSSVLGEDQAELIAEPLDSLRVLAETPFSEDPHELHPALVVLTAVLPPQEASPESMLKNLSEGYTLEDFGSDSNPIAKALTEVLDRLNAHDGEREGGLVDRVEKLVHEFKERAATARSRRVAQLKVELKQALGRKYRLLTEKPDAMGRIQDGDSDSTDSSELATAPVKLANTEQSLLSYLQSTWEMHRAFARDRIAEIVASGKDHHFEILEQLLAPYESVPGEFRSFYVGLRNLLPAPSQAETEEFTPDADNYRAAQQRAAVALQELQTCYDEYELTSSDLKHVFSRLLGKKFRTARSDEECNLLPQALASFADSCLKAGINFSEAPRTSLGDRFDQALEIYRFFTSEVGVPPEGILPHVLKIEPQVAQDCVVLLTEIVSWEQARELMTRAPWIIESMGTQRFFTYHRKLQRIWEAQGEEYGPHLQFPEHYASMDALADTQLRLELLRTIDQALEGSFEQEAPESTDPTVERTELLSVIRELKQAKRDPWITLAILHGAFYFGGNQLWEVRRNSNYLQKNTENHYDGRIAGNRRLERVFRSTVRDLKQAGIILTDNTFIRLAPSVGEVPEGYEVLLKAYRYTRLSPDVVKGRRYGPNLLTAEEQSSIQ